MSSRGVGWRARLAMIAAVAVAVGAGYMLWLRDSALVAVDDVEVVGVRSGDRERIVAELTGAAEGMTTLHVDRERLEAIAARFPTVAAIHVDPNFPHGLRIEVSERPPAVIATDGDERIALAADGTVLPGVAPPEDLPAIELDNLPATGKVGGEPLEEALIAGAAPTELAPLIEKISTSESHGVELILRGGIVLRFGTGAKAAAKWAAATAVLADPELEAVGYLDVRVPKRPALGPVA